MKFLVLAALVAVCAASPQNYFYSATPLAYGYGWNYPLVRSAFPYTAPVVAPVVAPLAVASKYHAQDVLGQTSFGHADPLQTRAEVRDIAGNVRGSYSYVDPNGKVNVVEYTAGSAGFRVLGANNLPVAPEVPATPELKAPEPVQDTPEVMAARAEFARKFAEAAEGKSRRRRQVLLTAPIVPAVAKATFKYSTYEPVDAAVPASTRKLELTEKEQEVLTPVTYSAYHAVVPTVKLVAEEKTPIAVKTIASPYVYNYGLTYPYVF